MALAARRDARMSVSEFRLGSEPRPDEERWELLDGEPVLMALPGERHQAIGTSPIRRIGDLADGKGRRALPGLAVLGAAIDGFAPIPEVVVRCGSPLPDGYAADPILVAEELSPATMSRDRGRETDFHRTVPSPRTFLIVCSDEARIEVGRRNAADWTVDALGPEGTVTLPELRGGVAVRDIDRGLAF